jgi:hypothetical protein
MPAMGAKTSIGFPPLKSFNNGVKDLKFMK